MKRLLLALVLLATCSTQAQAAIVRVNTARCDGGGSTVTITCPVLSATAGNAIFVFIKGTEGYGLSVADTAGNTYTMMNNVLANGNPRVYAFKAFNITGNASDVITITYVPGPDSSPFAFAIQYSGLTTTDPEDVVSGNYLDYTHAGTDHTAGMVTTSQANELVLMFTVARTGSGSSPTFTAGTGFTLVVGNLNPGSGDAERGAVQEYITSSILTSYIAHITTNISQSSSTILQAFKAAGVSSARPSIMSATGAGK